MSDKLVKALYNVSPEQPLPEFTTVHRVNAGGADNWQLTFKNGCTLSVVWGPIGSGAYSGTDTVELYAWSAKGYDLWDDVRGWQSMPELLDAIHEVANFRPAIERG